MVFVYKWMFLPFTCQINVQLDTYFLLHKVNASPYPNFKMKHFSKIVNGSLNSLLCENWKCKNERYQIFLTGFLTGWRQIQPIPSYLHTSRLFVERSQRHTYDWVEMKGRWSRSRKPRMYIMMIHGWCLMKRSPHIYLPKAIACRFSLSAHYTNFENFLWAI